jgi:hypothetical protein
MKMTNHVSRRLLSHCHPSAKDPECLPDAFYDFCSQFIYTQGSYADQINVQSLMLLLWQMQCRIDELENE